MSLRTFHQGLLYKIISFIKQLLPVHGISCFLFKRTRQIDRHAEQFAFLMLYAPLLECSPYPYNNSSTIKALAHTLR